MTTPAIFSQIARMMWVVRARWYSILFCALSVHREYISKLEFPIVTVLLYEIEPRAIKKTTEHILSFTANYKNNDCKGGLRRIIGIMTSLQYRILRLQVFIIKIVSLQ